MSGYPLIRHLLRVTVLTVAALLLIPPFPRRYDPSRENVAAGDSLLRCYITLDGSPSGIKGVNGGMSAFLMKKYASEAHIRPQVVFLKDGAMDSLAEGKVALVAAMAGDSLPGEGFFVSRQLGDSIVWVLSGDDPAQLLALNGWITDLVVSGDYGKLKKDYLRIRRSGYRLSPYDSLIKRYALRGGWDWRLISSVIRHESHFNVDVVSPRGAIGLMQILPYKYSAEQLFQPEFNIMAGTEYLSRLRRMFKPYSADSVQNVKFTLAAYNAGEGRILECIRFAEAIGVDATYWDSIAVRAIPRMMTFSGSQTIPYVDSILRTYDKYQLRYAY